MYYYEVIIDKEFIGVCTSNNMARYQAKHRVLLGTEENYAEFANLDGELYHAGWMLPVGEDCPLEYKDASILLIDEETYNALATAIENNEEIAIATQEEMEETVTEEYVYTTEGEEETIEYLVSSKVSEMSYACNKTISAGFDIVLSDGETHHFSLTTQDQLNLITLSTLIASGVTVIPYHADGEQCRYYSVEDITAIMNMATFFKTYQVSYFNALKLYVQSLTTVADIAAVYYGMEIPEEYVTEVLRNLMATASSDTE